MISSHEVYNVKLLIQQDETTIDLSEGTAGVPSGNTVQKRGPGAPKSNKNASTHGLFAARRALNDFGLRAIDGRSALGVAIREFRASVINDLGGETGLSVQQLALLDMTVRTKLMLDSIDVFILSQPSIVDKRRRSLLPIVRERASLANSFVEHMRVLGLEKRKPPVPTLAEIIAQHAKASEASKTSTDTPKRVPEPTSQAQAPEVMQ
jgi:hypothetical protein